MFKVGDVVSRNSYDNDINFKIINIIGDNAILAAKSYRLIADAPLIDLASENLDVRTKESKKEEVYQEEAYALLPKTKRKYVMGKILHIDGDKEYLEKCMKLYNKVGVFCNGVHIPESKMKFHVERLIKKYRPDIIIITGHDAYDNKNIKDLRSYRNSQNFVDTVNVVRNNASINDILVIAGACQSHFEALIASGANYASSPKRINIHAYDPAIIAIKAAVTSFDRIINMNEILKHSYIKREGLGGLESFGKLRVLV
ncbi:sporulation peptidase YabG [Mycoplasmatota bacterium WC44]